MLSGCGPEEDEDGHFLSSSNAGNGAGAIGSRLDEEREDEYGMNAEEPGNRL